MVRYAIEPITQTAIFAARVWFVASGVFGLAVVWQLLYADAILSSAMLHDKPPAFLGVVSVVSGIWLAVTGGACALGALWLYRAASNAAAIDPDPERLSPEWVVRSFFVPLANLWLPYRGVRETFGSSVGGQGGRWAHAPLLLHAWWFAWLLGLGFLGIALWLRITNAAIDAVAETDLIFLAAWVMAGLLWLRIVRLVANAQATLVDGVFA